MKSARLYAPGDLRLEEAPPPTPHPGEKLIRVRAVGICGSDLHWFEEAGIGDTRLVRPLVLGHEIAGETETGRLAAVDPAIPCGRCEYCLGGHPNLCPQVIFAGHGSHDGGLSEWLAWDEHNLHLLPGGLSAADGAMLEPLGVALHAVDLGKIRLGMSVGVFGCGPIGLLIIQLARMAGAARIIATDVLPHRVEAARMCGAHQAFPAGDDRAMKSILAGGGRELDLVFEAAGEQPAVDAAVAAVAPGGRVVLVGIPGDDRTSFQASTARRKGLTIKLVRRMKRSYARAIDLVAGGSVDVHSLVSHRFPLADAAAAFRLAARREGLKVLIDL